MNFTAARAQKTPEPRSQRQVRPGRGRLIHRTRRATITASTPLVAILVVLMLGAPAHAQAAPATPLESGVAGDPAYVIPTIMDDAGFEAADIDHDGLDELFAFTQDGIAQSYRNDGTFRWSIDLRQVLDAEGMQIGDGGSRFTVDYRYQNGFNSEAGVAFDDANGDGIDDIFVATNLRIYAPENAWRGAVLLLDGANGATIDLRMFEGFISAILVADVDNDAQNELVITEEDGTIGSQPSKVGDTFWGSGSPTRIIATENDGTLIWSHQTNRDWGKVTAIGTGAFDGGGPDIALAITASYGSPVTNIDNDPGHTAQDLVTLDGATGTKLWEVSIPDYARTLDTGDVDGDGVDDVVVLVQESAQASPSRGDARASAYALRGIDGAALWDLDGRIGDDASVFDVTLRHGSGGDTPDGVYITAAYDPPGVYNSADVSEVLRVDGPSGDILARTPLGLEDRQLVSIDLLDLGLPEFGTPAAAAETPTITHMRTAWIDIDGDEHRDDLVVKDDSGLTAFIGTSSGLVEDWRVGRNTEPQVLVPMNGPDGDSVLVQGRLVVTEIRTGAAGVGSRDDDGHYRLTRYDADDGARSQDIPLLSTAVGVAWGDLDGDGVRDRVLGGSSGAVFAFRGGSTELLWMHDFGNYILDLWMEDLNDNGRPDVFVRSHLEAGAIRGGDGATLWRYTLPEFITDAGEFRDVELEDIDGDGVRDMVIAFRNGKQGFWSAHRHGRVTVLSGTTGDVIWEATFAKGVGAVSLAIGDVNGDGVPDVAATNTIGQRTHYGVSTFDGTNGLPIWTVTERVAAGDQNALIDNVAMLDADEDGDLDVVVATRGHTGNAPKLRYHDGTSGDTIRVVALPISADHTKMETLGMKPGNVGPGGSAGVVVHAWQQGPNLATSHVFVVDGLGNILVDRVYDFIVVLEFAVGDVDGDGIDDVAFGSFGGFVVLDTGPNLAGNAVDVGHLAEWSTTKVVMDDVDGDGTMEVNFLTSAQNFPIWFGPWVANDIGGRSKAIGAVSFGSLDLPDPPNIKPVAEFVIDTDPIVAGETASFRSTAFDPDGTIATRTWTMGDGTTHTTTDVAHTYFEPGTYTVRLTVMDDEGATATTATNVQVLDPYKFTTNLDKAGALAAPGDSLAVHVTVKNTGLYVDTFGISAGGPASWNIGVDGATSVTLPAGASHTWRVDLDVADERPSLDVPITTSSTAGGTVTMRTFSVTVPLVMSVTLDDGAGPYGLRDTVSGTLRGTWLDGTPVPGAQATWTHNGQTGGPPLVLDGAGEARFTVEHDTLIGYSLGDHNLRFVTTSAAGHSVVTFKHFDVSILEL